MFWQKEYLRQAIRMTLNSTYQLDLPENGILGSLLIKVEGANVNLHGVAADAWRVLDNITKMEIILNGATICKSLRGDAVQALAFYDNGIPAPDIWRQQGTETQYCYFLINFGRHLYDPRYGLDLSKFANVELKVTNNAALATEFSYLDISILAIYMREGAAGGPLGYMRSETWREWTTVQDSTEYLDIPTEHPIRRIILQAKPHQTTNEIDDTGYGNLMDDIDFSMDTGQVRIYKGGLTEIAHVNSFEYGQQIITGGVVNKTADHGVNTGLGAVLLRAHGAGSGTGAGAAVVPTYTSLSSFSTQKPESAEANCPILSMWGGEAYHNTAVLRFDPDPDPSTWLDPRNRATVILNIHTRNTAVSAGGTNRVILDRFVRV